MYACGRDPGLDGVFYRSNGHGDWSDMERFEDDPDFLVGCLAVWGTGPDNIYLGTSAGVYHGVAN